MFNLNGLHDEGTTSYQELLGKMKSNLREESNRLAGLFELASLGTDFGHAISKRIFECTYRYTQDLHREIINLLVSEKFISEILGEALIKGKSYSEALKKEEEELEFQEMMRLRDLRRKETLAAMPGIQDVIRIYPSGCPDCTKGIKVPAGDLDAILEAAYETAQEYLTAKVSGYTEDKREISFLEIIK